MSASDWTWTVSFVMGAAVTIVLCAERFRSPSADRSYTTLYRYSIALAYYSVAHVGVYYLIAASLSWILERRDIHSSAPEPVSIWLALCVTMALSRLPLLSRIDQSFRQHARVIGGIPTEARLLRNAIREAECHIQEQGAKEIQLSVLRRGLDLGNMRSVPDQTLHGVFLHASQLRYLIDQCLPDPRFAKFISENGKALHDFARRFDHLVFKSSRGVDVIGGLHDLVDSASGKSDNWESLGSLVENQVYADRSIVLDPAISTSRMLISNLREDMRFFVDDAAMFLARIALYHAYTERGRVALLRAIGLSVGAIDRPRYTSVFVVFAAVFVSMLIGVTAFGPAASMSVRETSAALIMVPTFFVISLFCAIYPKQHFTFANPILSVRLPYFFFVSAGLASVLVTFVVALVFLTLIFQDAQLAWRNALAQAPWLLMPWTVTLTVSILIQQRKTAFTSAASVRRRRCLDSIVLALALGLACAAVQLLLPFTDDHVPREQLWRFVSLAMIMGAFVGFFVPVRYRLGFIEAPVHSLRMDTGQVSAAA